MAHEWCYAGFGAMIKQTTIIERLSPISLQPTDPKAESLYPRESLGALRPQLLGSDVSRLPAMSRAASWLSYCFWRSSWALRHDVVRVTVLESGSGSTW